MRIVTNPMGIFVYSNDCDVLLQPGEVFLKLYIQNPYFAGEEMILVHGSVLSAFKNDIFRHTEGI